jgi:membrane fusion protein (multidrug efflux system)
MKKEMKQQMRTAEFFILVAGLVLTLTACGGDGASDHGPGASGHSGQGGPPGNGAWEGSREPTPETEAGVPVEVVQAERRSISSYLETNGTLEAENEVDIVARTSGPVVELAVEEGMLVKAGRLLARIDDTEIQAQLGIAHVALEEAKRSHERAKLSRESKIISQEVYDQALTQLESAEAQLRGNQVLLEYTRIQAPFDGIIIERYIKYAENVTPNQQLFRISDFDPLLCPIQVPEKELASLKVSQPAHITVEAWPDERFSARVLRISPVVDPATGTIKVTLQVAARGKLSPGMFASVFLVTDSHSDALVIPKAALSLESLGDTVYVVKGDLAERRDIELGYEESDSVEVLSGISTEDRVVVVGQDGLSDGTPVYVLKGPGTEEAGSRVSAPQPTGDRDPGGGRGDRMDLSQLTPERLEQIKERMRERGMSDEQIEEMLRKRRGQPANN